MSKYFAGAMKILTNSINSIDDMVFDRLINDCINTLDGGHKIVVTGLGKNVPVCDKFVGSMLSLGQEAGFMHTNSAVHGDLGMVRKGDLVIFLTKSGETIESIYLVELLQERKQNIWLITFTLDSTLTRKLVDRCLIIDLEHEGDPWNIAPNNSTTVNLIVLQGLAMEIVRRRGFSISEYRINHPGGHIGELLKNV
jgi:arabinose-5-phosphate isomerase